MESNQINRCSNPTFVILFSNLILFKTFSVVVVCFCFFLDFSFSFILTEIYYMDVYSYTMM